MPSGDIGFWQTALRDPRQELHRTLTERLSGEPSPIAVDLYYGDHEGGQHAITRFYVAPDPQGTWRSSVIFHWILEGGDPPRTRLTRPASTHAPRRTSVLICSSVGS